ncbi:hypothetical protein C7974DRAFT_376030 [Boeremia exigua]|uniref:uncharacterized protein n=1 Tax=Boeremia exigua TaxID=749465 RepID=UPI001E8CAA04|nr:uncharacterized protein C7974DRAFT_376030 [Boeremia exigua]KAH6629151.1 hypothetical protein C7974DRAFT_376030 [Boeremia exigua]
MPPRSVCLNVFTTSLGEAGTAVREGREVNPHELTFGRRDSAQSLPDDHSARRSSSASPSSAATSPPPAFNRADLFNSLRPAASTESLSSAFAFGSKACSTCSGQSARLRCSRCKNAYYCDKACQKSSWKAHRQTCEPASQMQGYSAPATPDCSNPASPTNA